MSTRPKTERRKEKSKNLKTPLPILMKIKKSSSERDKKKRELVNCTKFISFAHYLIFNNE